MFRCPILLSLVLVVDGASTATPPTREEGQHPHDIFNSGSSDKKKTTKAEEKKHPSRRKKKVNKVAAAIHRLIEALKRAPAHEERHPKVSHRVTPRHLPWYARLSGNRLKPVTRMCMLGSGYGTGDLVWAGSTWRTVGNVQLYGTAVGSGWCMSTAAGQFLRVVMTKHTPRTYASWDHDRDRRRVSSRRRKSSEEKTSNSSKNLGEGKNASGGQPHVEGKKRRRRRRFRPWRYARSNPTYLTFEKCGSVRHPAAHAATHVASSLPPKNVTASSTSNLAAYSGGFFGFKPDRLLFTAGACASRYARASDRPKPQAVPANLCLSASRLTPQGLKRARVHATFLCAASSSHSTTSSSGVSHKNNSFSTTMATVCRRAAIEGFSKQELFFEQDFLRMARGMPFRTWYAEDEGNIFKTKLVSKRSGWRWAWRPGVCVRRRGERGAASGQAVPTATNPPSFAGLCRSREVLRVLKRRRAERRRASALIEVERNGVAEEDEKRICRADGTTVGLQVPERTGVLADLLARRDGAATRDEQQDTHTGREDADLQTRMLRDLASVLLEGQESASGVETSIGAPAVLEERQRLILADDVRRISQTCGVVDEQSGVPISEVPVAHREEG